MGDANAGAFVGVSGRLQLLVTLEVAGFIQAGGCCANKLGIGMCLVAHQLPHPSVQRQTDLDCTTDKLFGQDLCMMHPTSRSLPKRGTGVWGDALLSSLCIVRTDRAAPSCLRRTVRCMPMRPNHLLGYPCSAQGFRHSRLNSRNVTHRGVCADMAEVYKEQA